VDAVLLYIFGLVFEQILLERCEERHYSVLDILLYLLRLFLALVFGESVPAMRECVIFHVYLIL
jgi:hypothetical protein